MTSGDSAQQQDQDHRIRVLLDPKNVWRTGFVVIALVVLFALISAMIVRFKRHDALAAAMLLPYLAWVGYATSLNAGFWWLNR